MPCEGATVGNFVIAMQHNILNLLWFRISTNHFSIPISIGHLRFSLHFFSFLSNFGGESAAATRRLVTRTR
ncbi:hypothetical protein V6N13_088730 [Hibiscus sabdariffa]